jgi:hypothetical protein
MPNHQVVAGTDPEKGQYGYDENQGGVYEEPFVHSHATVAGAAGTGGATHRGLKSRHIQFLYVLKPLSWSHHDADATSELSVVLLELVFSSDQARFSPWLAPRPCSWLI